MDDVDELAGDTVPCSPGAVLRHDHETQPTQVLGGAPGRLRNGRSSSPASIVEVPASSPFQQAEKRSVPTPTTTAPPKPKSLGTRLAPAGTVFRPPPKRPATSDPVHVISDDEDEDEGNTQDAAPRGDIRPTTFQTRISSFMYNQASGADKERKTREKLRQIYDVFGPRYPSDMVRRALRETDDDVEEAMAWLEKNGKKAAKGSAAKTAAPASKAVAPPAPKAAAPKPRRLVSKASLQATRPSPAASASPSPSPEKPKPKRQLVRGLRNVETTPSPKKQPPPSSADPLVVVDLVENDRDDAYEAEASPDPDDDDGLGRVLECINTCTAAELAAMTSLKEAQLEPIMERRPFADLDEARDVSAARKPGARKTARTSIGESVVDAIEVFLDAVEAIDHIVSECENKARTVNAVMDTWEVNSFGYKRGAPTAGSGSSRNTPDLPPTPTSLSAGKLCKPPIPAQPTAMDGHCTMKPFQLFGLNWMSLLHTYDIGCILADEMGLGKTCQVISLMAHLVEAFEKQGKDVDSDERPWPNLVVVPPSTYNNWLAEFAKFAPDLKVVGYRGSQGERMEIAEEVAENPQEVHVVLGTYSQINSESDVDSLNSMGLHAAVFDEGHKMKNPETKIYRDLRRIRTDWKMLLTGRFPGTLDYEYMRVV